MELVVSSVNHSRLSAVLMTSAHSDNQHDPWFKDSPAERDIYEAEAYEFVETGNHPLLQRTSPTTDVPYEQGSTINWLKEEAAERERKRVIHSRRGLHGLLSLVAESVRTWLIVILSGLGVGVAGAWLDVLVKWYVAALVPGTTS